MPYTLINQETLDEIFPECKKRGIGIIIGAPFSSGILIRVLQIMLSITTENLQNLLLQKLILLKIFVKT